MKICKNCFNLKYCSLQPKTKKENHGGGGWGVGGGGGGGMGGGWGQMFLHFFKRLSGLPTTFNVANALKLTDLLTCGCKSLYLQPIYLLFLT